MKRKGSKAKTGPTPRRPLATISAAANRGRSASPWAQGNGGAVPSPGAAKAHDSGAAKSDSPPRRLTSVKEACLYGRFGLTKCYAYINEGKIIAYKRGGSTLVDLDSIDAFHASLERIRPKGGSR